jgi:hypothetical protein
MPDCSFRWCENDAAWVAAADQLWASKGGPQFMCAWHYDEYRKAMTQPMPGLDPPSGASDFWQPSILEMIRQAGMEIKRRDQQPRSTGTGKRDD